MADNQERVRRLTELSMVPPLAKEIVQMVDEGPANPVAPAATLYVLRDANLASTGDQQFEKVGDWAIGAVLHVIATDATATPTGCVGGIYTSPSKGGSQVSLSSQNWANMTTPNRVLHCQLGATPMNVGGNVYLSLTTAASQASTCDIYITGVTL
jgi:hypothetical protein